MTNERVTPSRILKGEETERQVERRGRGGEGEEERERRRLEHSLERGKCL
jgi:hypothetical protein